MSEAHLWSLTGAAASWVSAGAGYVYSNIGHGAAWSLELVPRWRLHVRSPRFRPRPLGPTMCVCVCVCVWCVCGCVFSVVCRVALCVCALHSQMIQLMG